MPDQDVGTHESLNSWKESFKKSQEVIRCSSCFFVSRMFWAQRAEFAAKLGGVLDLGLQLKNFSHNVVFIPGSVTGKDSRPINDIFSCMGSKD